MGLVGDEILLASEAGARRNSVSLDARLPALEWGGFAQTRSSHSKVSGSISSRTVAFHYSTAGWLDI